MHQAPLKSTYFTSYRANRSSIYWSQCTSNFPLFSLSGRLYHDELMQAQNLNNSLANIENLTSEKEIIEHAFTTDRKLRRAQVIVDWLEYNARKGKFELFEIM